MFVSFLHGFRLGSVGGGVVILQTRMIRIRIHGSGNGRNHIASNSRLAILPAIEKILHLHLLQDQ
jgi:hypothetical protein